MLLLPFMLIIASIIKSPEINILNRQYQVVRKLVLVQLSVLLFKLIHDHRCSRYLKHRWGLM